MFAKLALVGAALFFSTLAQADEEASQPISEIALACTGTMIAEGQEPPGSRILADGVVNLQSMRVRGFGMGSTTVISASATEVEFGSTALMEMRQGHTVEGTLNRQTGRTRIVVRSVKDVSSVLIDMDLECQLTPTRHRE